MWRGVLLFLRSFLITPPLRFADGKRGFMENRYPADACGAICLSFRALGKLSTEI
jgi:hypothetical protein